MTKETLYNKKQNFIVTDYYKGETEEIEAIRVKDVKQALQELKTKSKSNNIGAIYWKDIEEIFGSELLNSQHLSTGDEVDRGGQERPRRKVDEKYPDISIQELKEKVEELIDEINRKKQALYEGGEDLTTNNIYAMKAYEDWILLLIEKAKQLKEEINERIKEVEKGCVNQYTTKNKDTQHCWFVPLCPKCQSELDELNKLKKDCEELIK